MMKRVINQLNRNAQVTFKSHSVKKFSALCKDLSPLKRGVAMLDLQGTVVHVYAKEKVAKDQVEVLDEEYLSIEWDSEAEDVVRENDDEDVQHDFHHHRVLT